MLEVRILQSANRTLHLKLCDNCEIMCFDLFKYIIMLVVYLISFVEKVIK